MQRVLIAYTTMSGSTIEVAHTVAEEIAKQDWQSDVLPLDQVQNLASYDALILGAPMVMGWHRAALGFLKENREALRQMPLAIFVMCMSLTCNGEADVRGVPLCVDRKLAKAPQKAGQLSFKEQHTSITRYADPILQAAAPARPASLGFFGGCLDLARLSLLRRLFVSVVLHAQPGDYRNWEAICAWSGSLPAMFAS